MITNWIYLAIGLGLGLGSRWLFAKSQNIAIAATALKENLNITENHKQDTSVVLALQQTHLAYQLAQEMCQFKAGFLARSAHELRSPLNSMIGLHQLILSDLCDDPAEEREFIAQAHASALKLMQLIDEILDVARLEHGSNKLEIQPLQLSALLAKVHSLVHLLAANRNLKLQIASIDPDIYILADPRWLQQVLLSLIESAIAQMDAGKISISAQSAAKTVYIYLDIDLPVKVWSEPVDLIKQPLLNQLPSEKAKLSPGMKLLLNQTVMAQMQGKLEIVAHPNQAASDFTRLQLTIPVVAPETEFLEPQANLI